MLRAFATTAFFFATTTGLHIAQPRLRRSQPLAACAAADGPLPKLCVLDLDMCVWRPEMYELYEVPQAGECEIRGDLNGRGQGVTGVKSGGDVIQLFPGALVALQEMADGVHEGMRFAVASSADTPLAEEIGRAAMKILEVLPGVTVYDVLVKGWEDEPMQPPAPGGFERGPVNLQIGRQAPLTSDKSRTHFPALRDGTGVPYDEMLFFDDSVWSDHCRMVEANCKGVVVQRTPRGMQEGEWRNGLKKFAASKAGN